jgi:hypothetical protein
MSWYDSHANPIDRELQSASGICVDTASWVLITWHHTADRQPRVFGGASMIVMLAVLGGSTLLLLGLAAARWAAARCVEPDLDLEPDDDHSADGGRGLLLPTGHQPPPGLSPLSPSERFLAAEVSRGLRDLQLFLMDAA